MNHNNRPVTDIIHKKKKNRLLRDKHFGPVKSIQFNLDRTLMLSSSRDKTIRLWDTRDYEELACYESDRPFNDAAFNPLYADKENPK